MNKEEADVNYIERVTQNPTTLVTEAKAQPQADDNAKNFDQIAEAVIKGRKKQVIGLVEAPVLLDKDGKPVVTPVDEKKE